MQTITSNNKSKCIILKIRLKGNKKPKEGASTLGLKGESEKYAVIKHEVLYHN